VGGPQNTTGGSEIHNVHPTDGILNRTAAGEKKTMKNSRGNGGFSDALMDAGWGMVKNEKLRPERGGKNSKIQCHENKVFVRGNGQGG